MECNGYIIRAVLMGVGPGSGDFLRRSGYGKKELLEHLELLIEIGYIDGEIKELRDGRKFIRVKEFLLTDRGYDFLSKIRYAEVREKDPIERMCRNGVSQCSYW